MNLKQVFVSVTMSTLFVGGVVMATPESATEEYIAGVLTIGKKASYILYFGEDSGDSVIWYFDTKSKVGEKILSVCRAKSDCFVYGSTQVEAKVPKEIPESTSGTSKIISVSKISRKPLK